METSQQQLSVVIPTIEPWPSTNRIVDEIIQDCVSIQFEIIVVCGAENLSTGDLPEIEHVQFLHLPGQSVFNLRANGIKRAAYDIIAITEDHTEISRGWSEHLINTLHANPECEGVSGPIVNLTDSNTLDRAGFYISFTPYMPPLVKVPFPRVPPIANFAFKKETLINNSLDEEGWFEFSFMPTMAYANKICIAPEAQVGHKQSIGLMHTLSQNFHNARSTKGLGRKYFDKYKYAHELVAILGLPYFLFKQSYYGLKQKGINAKELLKVFPSFAALVMVTSLGQFVGFFLGAGSSPKFVH